MKESSNEEQFTTDLVVVESGLVIYENVTQFLAKAKEFREGIKTELVTDDDFDTAGKNVKMLTAIESIASKGELDIVSSQEKIYAAVTSLQKEKDLSRSARLVTSKSITTEKTKRKDEVVQKFYELQEKHFTTSEYAKLVNCKCNFIEAVKGKRTIKSMEDSCQEMLDRQIDIVTGKEEDYQKNITAMEGVESKYTTLFPDIKTIAIKSIDEVSAIVEARCSKLDTQLLKIETDRKEKERLAEEKRKEDERLAEEKRIAAEKEVKVETFGDVIINKEESPASNAFEAATKTVQKKHNDKPSTTFGSAVKQFGSSGGSFSSNKIEPVHNEYTITINFTGTLKQAEVIKTQVESATGYAAQILNIGTHK